MSAAAPHQQVAPAADELAAWLQLLETPRLGRQSARRLLAAFGSAQAVLAAGPTAWAGLIEPGVAQALTHPPASLAALIDRTTAWLAQGADRHVLLLGDAAYPAALLESPDPPLLLYAIGRLDLLQRPGLAMVGSRNPTGQGRDTARAFARALCSAGLTVTSGLALGIDAAAHEGGLDGWDQDAARLDQHGGGSASSIAVVGTGLDQVYPRSHRELASRLASKGLLLSEFSLGTPPLAQNFPMRNRIIAGLTLGTLVVEAALQSGSLITARLASEAGREVFAIPGSIHAPQSRGCHALIKQGAKLVESVDDILGELQLGPGQGSARTLPPAASAAAATRRSAAQRRGPDPAAHTQPTQALFTPDSQAPDDEILNALGWSAATLDVLLIRTGLSISELSVRLLTLELDGQVERLPGELFQRIAQA
jgi:DNA processing protein